jgi:hypothetical protein
MIHGVGCPDHDEEPKVFHLGDEMNRKKICNFIDKYVTRLYGSHHIQLWVDKNQNKTTFHLIKMSDLAYTVTVIENSHQIREQDKMYPPRLDERDGKETKKNHQLVKRPPSSQRELGKRENITRLDGIMSHRIHAAGPGKWLQHGGPWWCSF